MQSSLLHIIGKTAARILTGLLVCCMLVAACAGFIDPATWVIPSILCLVFLPLWLGVLAAGLLWLFMGRSKIDAIVCGAALLLSLPVTLTVSPIRFPSQPEPGQPTLSVLTYNVVECIDMEHPEMPYSRSLSYVIHSDADIVCLQEMYSVTPKGRRITFTEAQIDTLLQIYPYHLKIEEEEKLLLSKYPAKYVNGSNHTDKPLYSYEQYRIDVKGHPLNLISVHLPSYRLTEDQRHFASKLKHAPGKALDRDSNATLYRKLRRAFVERAQAARHLKGMTDTIHGPLIVCGDFNDVPGSYAYRLLRGAGLRDAYCDASIGPMVTYNAYHLLFHIDQILYREDCGMRCYKVSRGSLRSSDHYPVTARFVLDLDKMK